MQRLTNALCKQRTEVAG